MNILSQSKDMKPFLKYQSNPIQTHRNARSKFPWELDHMFATENLINFIVILKKIFINNKINSVFFNT